MMGVDLARLLCLLVSSQPQSVVQLVAAGDRPRAETLRQLQQLVDQGFIIAADDAGVVVYHLKPKTVHPAAIDESQRVLLVEDDPFIREVTVSILEDEGYAVIATGIVADAAVILDAVSFDLVISDSFSPSSAEVLTGHASILAQTGAAPVVLFTAHKVDVDAALAAGFRGLIGKPFDLTDFEDQVRRLLQHVQAPA